jgi:hypothetical protein
LLLYQFSPTLHDKRHLAFELATAPDSAYHRSFSAAKGPS